MPTTSHNGRTDLVGPTIELGDFLPERREVKINGQKYPAWVTANRRYPRSIMIKLDKAARVYNKVIAPLLEPLEENAEVSEERIQAADEQPEAWQEYVTTAVQLLVPQLLDSELELIDLPVLEGLLRDLGYFRIPEETEDEAEVQNNDPLIGDISPVASSSTIPSTV